LGNGFRIIITFQPRMRQSGYADEYSRECLAILVARRLRSDDVLHLLAVDFLGLRLILRPSKEALWGPGVWRRLAGDGGSSPNDTDQASSSWLNGMR